MGNDCHRDWREEILAEPASFAIVPSESVVVSHHEVVEESLLFGQEKVAVTLVELDHSF